MGVGKCFTFVFILKIFLFIVLYYFALLCKIFFLLWNSIRIVLLVLPGNCTKQIMSIACVLAMW